MAKTSYAIALGSNRRSRHGSPRETVSAAIAALASLGTLERSSAIVATPAMGPAGRGFANAAAVVSTDLAPDELLAALKAIERAFGRRAGRKWGPRILDLDIILWSGGAWGGPGPLIPHREFRTRPFVLEPLAEIVGDWRDPISGLAVRHLLHRRRQGRAVDPSRRRS